MAHGSPVSIGTTSVDDDVDSLASGRTYDTFDEIMSQFTLDFRPEYVLKIRNRLGPLVVGMDASHLPDSRETSGAILIKPVDRDSWWRRLRVSTAGAVTLRSRKLRWWVFTLDLEGSANALSRTTAASFRVATKWDLARGEYRNKRKTVLGDATEGRVHWHVNYSLPELEGSFGAGGGGRGGAGAAPVASEMHAEMGYAHAVVSKLELVAWPWRNNPKGPPAAGAGGGAEEEVAAQAVLAAPEGGVQKKDWVLRRLEDLEDHVAELRERWEERAAARDGGATPAP